MRRNTRAKGLQLTIPPFWRSRRFWAFFVIIMTGISLFLGYQFWQFFRLVHAYAPAQGGTYTEVTTGNITNLSPLIPHPTPLDSALHQLLHRGLLHYNPETGQIESALAEYTLNAEQTEYTLKIKEKARFANGDSVTAADVLFTFQEVISHPDFANEALRKTMEYTELTPVDDSTVRFTLPQPYIFFPSLLTTPVLQRKAFPNVFIQEMLDPDHPGNRKPNGAGPYKLSHIVPNDGGTVRVFLTANAYYYDGKPHISELAFEVIPNAETLTQQPLWAGGYSGFPAATWANLDVDTQGYRALPYVLPRWVGVFFQLDREIIAKTSIRKALWLSTPKSDLIEEGWGTIESPFFFDGILGTPAYDPQEARDVLTRGGVLQPAAGGNRTIDDEVVTLNIITSTAPPTLSRMGQKLVQAWRSELDLKINFEVLPPAEFDARVAAREYDMVLFGQSFGRNFDTLGLWHTEESGALNLSNLTNRGVDQAIYDLQQTGDQDLLLGLAEKIEGIIPVIPLATPTSAALVSGEIFGVPRTLPKPRTHADRFARVHDWYMMQKRVWPDHLDDQRWSSFWTWLRTDKLPETNE